MRKDRPVKGHEIIEILPSAAAAVDESAGRTEQAAVQPGIAHRNTLTGDEHVAPGLEKRGVELTFSGGRRGCGGVRDNRCEKRRALQRGPACGGQAEHFSAGKLVSRLIYTHCSSHVASVSSAALKATSRLVIVLPTKIRMNRMSGLCCRAAPFYPESPPLDWLNR